MQNKVKVELNYEEAELFKWFMQGYEMFLEAKRLLKPGSLTINFDCNGNMAEDYDLKIHKKPKRV